MKPRSLLALALLSALALVVPATAASGHASWLESSPSAGSTVDTAPSEVQVSFDSPLLDTGGALVVTSADGVVISEPAAVINLAEISVAVDPGAPPGVYTVAFRVVSEDGHTVSDSFDYTVAGTAPVASAEPSPADGTAAPVGSPVAQPPAETAVETTVETTAQTDGGSGGVPVWAWLIGAIALIAIVVAVAARRRRT